MLTVLMVALLAGCGKDRELYKKAKLENYIEVPEYKGITIDTNSDEFKEYYDGILASDIEDNDLYEEEKEGTVEDGYIANIDYVGKIDGVAFDGGSAKSYNLKIGSNTFIDDFEEELIGVKVGETKDVTATFPENYSNNPDLAGKEAIFTVTVNYLGRPMTVEEAYLSMNFASAEKYHENITSRAAEAYLFNYVCNGAKINDYPENDKKIIGDAIYEVYAADYAAQGYDFQQILTYNNITVESFKNELTTELMRTNMVMYYIFDAEGLELLESTLEKQTVSDPVLAESYAVQEIVIAFLYENAVIK